MRGLPYRQEAATSYLALQELIEFRPPTKERHHALRRSLRRHVRGQMGHVPGDVTASHASRSLGSSVMMPSTPSSRTSAQSVSELSV